MFYSVALLSRKGPLGNIWTAAYCFNKLKKDQITHTNISSSVDKIMPEKHMSYRVLAQLLLGIVKIFSKKVDYLYIECNEALAYLRRSVNTSQYSVPRSTVYKRRHKPKDEKSHTKYEANIESEEAISVKEIEAMRASSEDVTITVPQKLQLDCFNLDTPNDGEALTAQEPSTPQDHWIDNSNRDLYIRESYPSEAVGHKEFDYACFTPVNDVLPDHLLDIDIEMTEQSTLNNTGVGGQDILGEGTCSVQLEVKIPAVPNVPEGESNRRVHPMELRRSIQSDLEKDIRVMHGEPEQLNLLSSPEKCGKKANTTLSSENEKSPSHCDIGVPSPKFTVRTPAKREQNRAFRKRKCYFDEMVVLSNETLRKGISDASSLICKRRKSPHTYLDAWKVDRITGLQSNFLEPLITYMPLELKVLYQVESFGHSKDLHAQVLRKSGNAKIGGHNIHTEVVTANQETIQDLHTEVDSSNQEAIQDVETVHGYSEGAINDPYGTQMKDLFPSEELETQVDFMDQDSLTCEKQDASTGDSTSNGWTQRTRAIAKYLRNKFADLKSEGQERGLSLNQTLLGKPRTICARFFYETLVLKGKDCIDVEQSSPYSDITIKPNPTLEAMI